MLYTNQHSTKFSMNVVHRKRSHKVDFNDNHDAVIPTPPSIPRERATQNAGKAIKHLPYTTAAVIPTATAPTPTTAIRRQATR